MIKTVFGVVAVLVVPAAAAGTVAGPPASQAHVHPSSKVAATKLLENFIGHVVASNQFEQKAKEFVVSAWEKRRHTDEIEPFLQEALAVLNPRFRQGLEAFKQEAYERAERIMQELAGAEDPYLSVNAAAMAVKALVEQNELVAAEGKAEALLNRIAEVASHSFYAPEIQFLLAYCQLGNLKYAEALETLESLAKRFPHIDAQLQTAADRLAHAIRTRQEGGLRDVADLMSYAGRRLDHGDPGKSVQDKQARAVALLDELIKQAEEREKKSA